MSEFEIDRGSVTLRIGSRVLATLPTATSSALTFLPPGGGEETGPLDIQYRNFQMYQSAARAMAVSRLPTNPMPIDGSNVNINLLH
jgi:hypothetical protein